MTVVNMRSRLVEKYQYITADGVVYDLQDPPNRHIMFYEGDGLPYATYDTRSGPFQHGESVNSYRLKPRTIDVVIRHNGCSREEYLTNRVGLNNVLRHSRTYDNSPDPGVLRRTFYDGRVRDLSVFLARPPIYTWSNDWDSFNIQETLQFTAYNPVLFDPEQQAESSSSLLTDPPVTTSLWFPRAFPITFSTIEDVIATDAFTVTYAGDWEEYPFIEIVGPGTDFSIQHVDTGDLIKLEGYSINSNESVFINLAYGEKTIINNFGESLLGYVSDDSNLTKFRILPDPQLSGGVNHFLASVSFADVTTRCIIKYYNRYESI